MLHDIDPKVTNGVRTLEIVQKGSKHVSRVCKKPLAQGKENSIAEAG